jgi:hypothetical protein
MSGQGGARSRRGGVTELPLGRPSVPGSASLVGGTRCIHVGDRFALDRGCGCFGGCACECGARSGRGWALERVRLWWKGTGWWWNGGEEYKGCESWR